VWFKFCAVRRFRQWKEKEKKEFVQKVGVWENKNPVLKIERD